MFEELRAAMNAADWLWSDLSWKKESVIRDIENYSAQAEADPDDSWCKNCLAEAKARLDVLNAIEAAIRKYVKSVQ